MSASAPINPSAWDGTLSPHAFPVAAKALAARWAHISAPLPLWTWVSCTPLVPQSNLPSSKQEDDGYLSLEHVHHLSVSQCEPSGSENEEAMDDATLVQSYNGEAHIYDFHIVYSFSYRVPVLYFRAYTCDGQPLGLDDIEKDLPCHSLRILRESKWTYITKEPGGSEISPEWPNISAMDTEQNDLLQEHPYLHRPWYTLHPCGTSNWMRLLLCDTISTEGPEMQQYLLSWLSVVGQAIGLKVPFELHVKSLHECFASSGIKE